jgi:hypothetical protein
MDFSGVQPGKLVSSMPKALSRQPPTMKRPGEKPTRDFFKSHPSQLLAMTVIVKTPIPA